MATMKTYPFATFIYDGTTINVRELPFFSLSDLIASAKLPLNRANDLVFNLQVVNNENNIELFFESPDIVEITPGSIVETSRVLDSIHELYASSLNKYIDKRINGLNYFHRSLLVEFFKGHKEFIQFPEFKSSYFLPKTIITSKKKLVLINNPLIIEESI